MDVQTGEIKDANELTPEQIASDRWVELGKRPNPGCNHCHGRGWIGRDVVTGEVIVCRCVKKRPTRQSRRVDKERTDALNTKSNTNKRH